MTMRLARDAQITAGAAIFPRLKALGVDYVFANSGTDFPPIIEGLAEAASSYVDLPRALAIPHEHAAMGMAHGYYLVSGKAQAVMLHTNVGLANGAIGAINAACEHIPVILMSGRTPVTEGGRFGARTVPIGWGQEMRDQAALVRESCKWEYELRFPEQISGLLDRAYAIANSTPKGPVYLALPREVLCESVPAAGVDAPPSIRPVRGAPNPADVETAARWLAAAERPVIIAQRGAGDEASFHAFSRWAEEWAIPVSSWWTTHLAIATDHACHVGSDPGPWLVDADVVLVLDSIAPWWPDRHPLPSDARVIQIGPDPMFSRYPVRNFRSDLTIAGESDITVPALIGAMAALAPPRGKIEARRERISRATAAYRLAAVERARSRNGQGITKAWVSLCLGDALRGRKSSVFSELGSELDVLERRAHGSWFQEPHSGGLGWSFPAALGARLADPERICVATPGDGSYIFANPVACHQIAEALELAILVIVLNNGEWGAVRQAVGQLYPHGYAAMTNQMPLTTLRPVPDFRGIAEASRAWARRVERPEDVPGAIAEALDVVTKERRLALLDVQIISG